MLNLGKTTQPINALLTVLLTATTLSIAPLQADSPPKNPKIFINQFVNHPALNANREGIYAFLRENVCDPDTCVTLDMAQGNVTISTQIAQKFVGNSPDVMVGMGTLASQSLAAAAASRLPVVFTSVTDPLDAKLVSSLKSPGANITGVSNMTPLAPQLAFFRELIPGLKRIGVVYNPGEANSIVSLKRLKEETQKLGIEVVTASISKTSEVMGAASSLIGKVDIFFVDNDNTVLSAFPVMVKVGATHQIPLFVSDTDIVEQGALGALGPNQFELGRKTGEIIARILEGENPGTIDVVFPENLELVLNRDAAQKMGVTLPEAILKRAKKVI